MILTEASQAETFAGKYRDELLYDVAQKSWVVYKDGKWRLSAGGYPMKCAVQAARDLREDALASTGYSDALWGFAKRCESNAGVTAVLNMAKGHMEIEPGGWDNDPLLIGCPNGIFDLRQVEFREATPQDRLLLSTKADYDDYAECPRWEQFIEEIFEYDEPTIAYVHRIAGYWLTGQTDLQLWWMLLGGGSNGKSLFFGTIAHVLGSYAKSLPLSAVIASHSRSATGDDLAGLDHIRFCYVPETIEEARLDDARLKALTGCDTIAVRHLYGRWFDLQPSLKLVLSANRPPAVKDSSHGFWRRVRVIPFERQFVEGVDLDPGLKDTLLAESSGILNWLIRGYMDWKADGLETPETVLKATARYARESDHMRDFQHECCDISPDGTLEHLVHEGLAMRLYDAYKWWVSSRRIPNKEVMSSTVFGSRLSEQFQKKHTRSGRRYIGIRVRPDVEMMLPSEKEGV